MNKTTGALIVGGNLNGLSIARSLGRRGVPVWIVCTPDAKLASYSRYVKKTLPWPTGDCESQAVYLLDLAKRFQLNKWVLFPTSDESAALLSKFRNVLSQRFRVSTPAWEVLHWAFDKRLSYRLAAEEKVDYPTTIYPTDEADPAMLACRFPAILKPATHSVASRFTAEKAWPVADRAELIKRYREARGQIPPELILVQELIPGNGEAQFSYVALCCDGIPIASFTARRTRQYPIDFGYSSSFVETLDVPEIVAPSRRLLAAIRYTGLVEIEYKFDARDGRYKLLDINPRLWTWAPLGARAGVDFPYLLWQMMTGEPVSHSEARMGVHWVRLSTDIPAALHSISRGTLSFKLYLRSLRGPIEFALMAADDPLPGLLELPLFFYKHIYNGLKAVGAPTPPAPRSPHDGVRVMRPASTGMQSLGASTPSSPTPELKPK
jgi:D-aspartate ligase